MVNRDLILKELILAIEKCGKKPSYSLLSLSNHVKGCMNKFAKSTRNLEYEKGVIIDGKGNIIAEFDGDNDSCYIPCDEIIKTKLTDVCKDLLEEYDKEIQKYDVEDDRSSMLYDEYHQKIWDRLNSLGSEVEFHIDHNHPGAFKYGKNDAKLDYNVFTCLSEKDFNYFFDKNIYISIETPNGIPFSVSNCVKSMTCECSNGSRMTLVNNNPFGKDVYSSDFRKAMGSVGESWGYYRDALPYKTGKYMEQVLTTYPSPLSPSQQNEVREDVNNWLKKEAIDTFPNKLQDSIQKFDDIGMELRVDWL